MNSNDILFWIKNSVSIAGDNIEGTCFLRLIDDIKQANVQLIFIAFEYSKILHKRQIPYDANNPQMIPEKLLEKKKEIQISQESPKIKVDNNNNNQKKKYELKNGTLFQITRQYGVNDDYTYIQDLYSGTIKRGDYTFPFQIPTRFSMNSSFMFKNTNGLQQAKIGYKLYLKVQDTDSHQIILQKGTPIYINSRHKICEESRESEGNIVQFCCIHRGMIELGIRIQKNVYKPGEMLELEYILNTTRAQRDITRVEIRFKHFLSFTDNDETERIITNTTLFSNILPGIVAGKRSEILKSSILIPSDLQATIKTKFIRNHYLLEIEAYAQGLLTSLAIPVICQIPVIILERKKQIKPNTLDWKVNSHSQENNQFYCFTLSQQKLFN